MKNFNEGMREFFDSGRCGDVNYVDTYNMTERLGVDHPEEVGSWTYDSMIFVISDSYSENQNSDEVTHTLTDTHTHSLTHKRAYSHTCRRLR